MDLDFWIVLEGENLSDSQITQNWLTYMYLE